ncbi:MAG TPA: heparinase II/III family protein, partial [Paludibacter sp.]|nr:heparinase II/III family protein [Paludibacter sp.]
PAFLVFLFFVSVLYAETSTIQLPKSFPQGHPRVLTSANTKDSVKLLIQKEAWAKEVFEKIQTRTDRYANQHLTDSDWLVSRLQMYWKTHCTDVFIKGEKFAYAGGEKAPVPTVRFTGSRATTTIFSRPKLEDIIPFMDDEKGLLFINNSKTNKPLEWADPAETGRNIESINREIMGIARDASFLYWITGEDKYASLARDVFDMYMTGMYYRNVPIDLNHGHQQTLVGLSSFEVIHEDILDELIPLYDFLYSDLKKNKAEKMNIYAVTFKKWADIIIDHGVPHNNWDLFQANYILNIGLVLEDNKNFTDGKGREYYIDYVLNKSSIRQWSLPRLMEYGFDKTTGIWAECPGYSNNVVGDFANFIAWFDRNLNYDILPQFPIIAKAVAATPQYLFPNGNIVGFGDTHADKPRTDFFARMIANAQKYRKKEQEKQFTALYKLMEPKAEMADSKPNTVRAEVTSFFTDKPLKLDPTVPAAKMEDAVSPTFWAPNVSWFVQRNGMNPKNSLMISMNGSEGNHQHANGISMELYGKGYTLAPDAGIGSGYFSLDYTEYYSQFPSHNTVCVDGISSYPVMKSNHAFELKSSYPASTVRNDIYKGITFCDVYFREPETYADQTRMMSIVTTGEKTGYYVDIFRSHKVKGDDKMHDYFYHNLGRKMTITCTNGDSLNFKPTEELAFAGAHLYGYSYLYNKKSVVTNKDVKATFTMNKPDGDDIYMNMWMKGQPDREIFSALAPMTEGMSRTPGMPYNVKETPTLTYVARQNGEAWTRPFVSVFEPSSTTEPSNIASVSFFESEAKLTDFVGIKVESKVGRTDYIFSNSNVADKAVYKDYSSQSTYSVIGTEADGDCVLFMGNGTLLSAKNVTIKTVQPANVTVEMKQGKWYYTAGMACKITISGKTYNLSASGYKLINN